MIETRPMVAYTDETGNSGMQMFDANQPYFWTGTLLTPVEWDSLSPAINQACLDRAKCSELHANTIGFAGIEKIAGKLMNLFRRYGAKFLFTRIEKSHFVAMKFVDVLMDSGLNDAVSLFHYGARFNRLYLAHVLEALLDSDDLFEFWDTYKNGNAKGLVRILHRIEGRLHCNVGDERTLQLLLDAVNWGMKHPEPLLVGTRSPLDSPNVVALTLLVHELHRINDQVGLTVKAFIHDEQQQFGRHLKKTFEASKLVSDINGSSPLAQLLNFKEMATFDCAFRMTSSKKSFGLQALDTALWIKKRYTDDPDSVRGKCLDLARFIDEHGFTSEFTTDSMRHDVSRGFQLIESGPPLSVAQERKAREFLSEIETARLKRMNTTEQVQIPGSGAGS